MANVTSVKSLAELQVEPTSPDAVVILTEPGRAGRFVWRSGNFAGQIKADPLKGIYIPSSATMPTIGCWVRDWDEANGRPEWFGARPGDPAFDNVAALSACFAACPVTQLSAADYYVQSTLVFDRSNRGFVGTPGAAVNPAADINKPGTMGPPGGSRVILAGPRVVSATILHFGRLKPGGAPDESQMMNAVLKDIAFCRDNSGAYRAQASPTGDLVDCVKGIICAGASTCRIENISSYDSPVGWHCFGCVYTKWDDCSAWRATPAPIARADFAVGFLIGSYGTNYGYAGSNASVYFNRCICYDIKGGAVTIGMRLFGAVADVFLTQPEVGRCQVGIEIDGRGVDGRTIPESALGTQQDIHIINPIIDQATQQGLQLRNLNRSFQVSVTSPYITTANGMADIHVMGGADRVEGHVSIIGGTMLSGGGRGLVATDAVGITLIGTLMRNYGTPVSLTNCRTCRIEPDLNNYAITAARGIYLKEARRCSVKPIMRGAAGTPGFASGVWLDGGAGNTIDPTMIDYDVFSDPSPARKVLYNGRDARSDAEFKAAGNVLSGATG